MMPLKRGEGELTCGENILDSSTVINFCPCLQGVPKSYQLNCMFPRSRLAVDFQPHSLLAGRSPWEGWFPITCGTGFRMKASESSKHLMENVSIHQVHIKYYCEICIKCSRTTINIDESTAQNGQFLKALIIEKKIFNSVFLNTCKEDITVFLN